MLRHTPSADHKYPTSTGPSSNIVRPNTGSSVANALAPKVYKVPISMRSKQDHPLLNEHKADALDQVATGRNEGIAVPPGQLLMNEAYRQEVDSGNQIGGWVHAEHLLRTQCRSADTAEGWSYDNAPAYRALEQSDHGRLHCRTCHCRALSWRIVPISSSVVDLSRGGGGSGAVLRSQERFRKSVCRLLSSPRGWEDQ